MRNQLPEFALEEIRDPSIKAESDAVSESSGVYSSAGSHGTGTCSRDKSLLNGAQRANRGTGLSAYLIALIGSAACASFLYLGIASAKQDQKDQFDRLASELVHEVSVSWQDYEVAGLWIHESCRKRDITREDFRSLYEHLRWGGLEFQAAEFIPKVFDNERAEFEENSRAYYSEFYPELGEYRGFVGLEEDESGELSLQPRSSQLFYYPVHFVEPVVSNSAARDFDLYSSASRRSTIETALRTWQPTLTSRLRLVQETDESAYSVLLMHPGIPIEGEPDLVPTDLSLMVIRIPSLLERATRNKKQSMQVYLYDSTSADEETEPQFLGAGEITRDKDWRFLPEEEYSTLRKRHASNGKYSIYYEVPVTIASSEWSIIVVPIEGTYKPEFWFVILGGVMMFVASLCLAFWMYHNSKHRAFKMQQIIEKAEAERFIVSSMFPSNVRDRLIEEATGVTEQKPVEIPEVSMTKSSTEHVFGSKPIADLFPEATIMFADMVGFTAWSSVREPAQVFTLLETVYHSFDSISKKLRVFKVETVGDCYVAVAGLPRPRKDHAVIMARFATECLIKMQSLARELEPALGPDTGDIDMRIGLHSGPVTAGVLRGLKGRFQLFGDAMNTASRMESTGRRGMIQVSQETADLIRIGGKSSWLTPREDVVIAKGKGELQTYWLNMSNDLEDFSTQFRTSAVGSSKTLRVSDFSLRNREDTENKKTGRLVEWNVQVLSTLLKKVIAWRLITSTANESDLVDLKIDESPLDEVKDIITLPSFQELKNPVSPDSIQLDAKVMQELSTFVATIASLYRPNAFHNFEHASHVTMSVTKLLFRIVNPSNAIDEKDKKTTSHNKKHPLSASDIHTGTFGISSDPLTQFACAFAALIHDVDHFGVPNATLVDEGDELARNFKNKSVLEQNSVEIAWKILMTDKFTNLRKCICSCQKEFVRFRQLVVNLVMATDVIDKDAGALRRSRWEKAFTSDVSQNKLESTEESHEAEEDINRKATIVLEHLIQASDVSHTMQHWHVYIKWNKRLFHEMYSAYKQGRIKNDPSEGWFEGEKAFFDYYIIPLAKKLEICGVFGVSSHEYLDYAVRNRQEWDQKGREMVEDYLKSINDSGGTEQKETVTVSEYLKLEAVVDEAGAEELV